MIKSTLFYSIALVLLGIVTYFATGMVSLTALIPTLLGVITLLCLYLSLTPALTKHVMHIAAMLSALGFLASVKGFPGAIKHIKGVSIERPAAAIEQSIMALLCLWYFIVCFKWFLNNRRKKAPQVIA